MLSTRARGKSLKLTRRHLRCSDTVLLVIVRHACLLRQPIRILVIIGLDDARLLAKNAQKMYCRLQPINADRPLASQTKNDTRNNYAHWSELIKTDQWRGLFDYKTKNLCRRNLLRRRRTLSYWNNTRWLPLNSIRDSPLLVASRIFQLS